MFAVPLVSPSFAVELATEFAELAVFAGVAAGEPAVLAVAAGVEGSGVMLEGTATLGGVEVVVAGWLTDDGTGAGLAGVATELAVEGAARRIGALFAGVEALTLAVVFAGALVTLLLSSRSGALAGLLAFSSTAGRASATIAGLSVATLVPAGAAAAVVDPATAAGGGVTSATTLSER